MLFLALLGKTTGEHGSVLAFYLLTRFRIHQPPNAILASLAKPYHVVGG
jgi:hypothetical protein